MPRVPNAGFSPALEARLRELWGGEPPNLYRALANQPALCAAWAEFANALRHDCRTPRALRELVILRVAQLARSTYEWAHHLGMARRAGLAEEKIAALGAWRGSEAYTGRERAALALAEAVWAGSVADAVHAEAKRHFDDADYVELVLTASFYAVVARVLDALQVELDESVRGHAPRQEGA